MNMRIKKKDFLETKHYIKSLCYDSLIELCNKVGLTEYETKLMIHTNKDDTRIYTSMKLGVCESTVSKSRRKTITKIYDYLKRNNLDI